MSAWGGVEPVSPSRHFAKVGVEGSNPFARSRLSLTVDSHCAVAEPPFALCCLRSGEGDNFNLRHASRPGLFGPVTHVQDGTVALKCADPGEVDFSE
jgi:hypothetical protein